MSLGFINGCRLLSIQFRLAYKKHLTFMCILQNYTAVQWIETAITDIRGCLVRRENSSFTKCLQT